MIMREIIAHYKKTSCFVYIFFLIGYGALSLRFIWQTRKSIVGDTCDVSVPRDSSVKITPKIPAKFASLNSSIARGALRSRRCLRGASDAKFAEVFGVILTDGSRGTETTHVSPTMDLRVCRMKRRERAPHHSQLKKKYIQSNLFSYNALLFLAWSCFSSFLPAVRTGTALGSAPSTNRWRHREGKNLNTKTSWR